MPGLEIYIGDELVNHVPPDKRDTAMVFQSYALFPNYNIYDNIAYGLKIRKLSKQSIHAKVMDIIRLVGLEGMETRQINQISGGQQQRVALARALVVEPGVLLFDEPLSNSLFPRAVIQFSRNAVHCCIFVLICASVPKQSAVTI